MKKLLISLLVLFMLSGCSTTKTDVAINEEKILEEYLDKLENYQVRQKNKENDADNEKFNEFLDEIFRYYCSLDFLSMHYTVIDYKKYKLVKPEVNIGKTTYGFDEEAFNDVVDQLKQMAKFDFDSLSYKQQYDYEVLEYSLIETIISNCISKYNKPFDSSNNVIETVVDNLINYTFYDLESVDDYMILLQDVDRFLSDSLEITSKQAKDGIYLLDESIETVTDYAQSFVNSKNNTLIDSFITRINDVDFLTDEQIDTYIKLNEEYVNNEILPAVEKTSEQLKKYKVKTNYEKSKLINISENYAKAKYYLAFSNNRPIEEVFNDILTCFRYFETEFVLALSDEKKYDAVYNTVMKPSGCLALDAVDTLEYLKQHSKMFYPDLGDVSYNVDFLSDDTGETSTKAYYFQAPIDNYNQNIIRVNPHNIDPGTDAFETLAHEGFPGHLYQKVYALKNTDEHEFRSVMSFIGESEGYAVTAQLDCLNMIGFDDEQIANAIFFNDCDYFLMYSLIDIAANYLGYTTEQIVDLFMSEENYEIYDINSENIEGLINYIIDKPALYCSYGAGFANFIKLRFKAKQALDDKFNLVDFNNYVLKNGTIPFNLLDGCINEYIERYQ